MKNLTIFFTFKKVQNPVMNIIMVWILQSGSLQSGSLQSDPVWIGLVLISLVRTVWSGKVWIAGLDLLDLDQCLEIMNSLLIKSSTSCFFY